MDTNIKCPKCGQSVMIGMMDCPNCGESMAELMIEFSLTMMINSLPVEEAVKYFTKDFIHKIKGDSIDLQIAINDEKIILPDYLIKNEYSRDLADTVLYKIKRLHTNLSTVVKMENFEEAQRLHTQFEQLHEAIIKITDFK